MSNAVRASLVDNLAECETRIETARKKVDALEYDPGPVKVLKQATEQLVEDVEQLTEDLEQISGDLKQVTTQDLEETEAEDAGDDRAGTPSNSKDG
jgi:uncharacterized protein YoxC